MRMEMVVAVALLVLCVSAPVGAADDAAGPPLRNITIAGGQQPNVERTAEGFIIRNAARIEAEVDFAPDAFLCRLEPGGNPDVVQLSIGRVNSLRCNSLYSPGRDEGLTFLGKRVALRWAGEHYRLDAHGPVNIKIERDFMKTKRGLKWFKPLDKSVFKRAPAGWCSWYVYHQGVTEEEVVKNTDWIADNLKKFGCEYVQIDDGWQGVGHGHGDNRDWYVTVKEKFPHGMKWLADYIRAKGLKPGIWVIPFATSNEQTFREKPELFIRRPDGTSIGEQRDENGKLSFDWTGRYIVDPTGEAGQKWFQDLFKMLCLDWGYDYVKIDGQGGSRGACERWHDRLSNPKLAPDDAYRAGLAAIKSVMGPERFLLNCAAQYDSCGYCEGIRIGGDVGPRWEGMQPAIKATMAHLYVNNICFWADPDVVCVRPKGDHGSSLTLDQARVWATLVGITGQLLMASDDMCALPEERVELLRRIFPPADIRPMELYPLEGKPRIFDLRVSKPGVGEWDVIALFNWDVTQSARLSLRGCDLGLPEGEYIFYDVWRKQLLAVGSTPLPLSLPPTSCRVVALRRLAERPQLVGTSRHITQGADDLLKAEWDARKMTWRGRSKVVGGDPYELRFSLPPGWRCADAAARVDGPLAVLTLHSEKNETLPWEITFARQKVASASPSVRDARLESAGRSVRITWAGANALAYRVYRNGELLAQVAESSFTDYVRRKGAKYRYEVSAVGWGSESARVRAGEFVVQSSPRGKAKDIWLESAHVVYAEQDWGHLKRGKSVQGNPIRIAGKEYEHGLGTHANSKILIMLNNRYQRFDAEVGVDDEKGGIGSVVFQVFADGEKVFDSGVLKGKQPAKKVSVPLEGVDELVLVVTDAGDGINCDHADWANARLVGNR